MVSGWVLVQGRRNEDLGFLKINSCCLEATLISELKAHEPENSPWFFLPMLRLLFSCSVLAINCRVKAAPSLVGL